MGIVIYLEEWKKKKKLEEEAKKRRSFNPLGAIKTKAQKIKEAMDKYGSHQGKDKNKDKDK